MDGARFIRLWDANLGKAARCPGATVFSELERRYAEPARYYHNGEHIRQLLYWFDRYRDHAREPVAVELAIWFHDACYGKEPAGHEARSASMFQSFAGEASPELQARVVELIMATTHQEPPVSSDAGLLVDIDLSSFARPWHAFLKDTAQCRAEKCHLADQEFCACQIGFLHTLLARRSLFYSEPFQAHHEADARANIQRLVTLLEKRGQRFKRLP